MCCPCKRLIECTPRVLVDVTLGTLAPPVMVKTYEKNSVLILQTKLLILLCLDRISIHLKFDFITEFFKNLLHEAKIITLTLYLNYKK